MSVHEVARRGGELAVHVTGHLAIVVVVGTLLALTLPVRLTVGACRVVRSALRESETTADEADRRGA